jgi:hypothetical protein
LRPARPFSELIDKPYLGAVVAENDAPRETVDWVLSNDPSTLLLERLNCVPHCCWLSLGITFQAIPIRKKFDEFRRDA